MDLKQFKQIDDFTWQLEPTGKMRVPGMIYGDHTLLRDMDQKVAEQVQNVASLPGIVQASYAMPDAHWGYGFPIGGVAAFDPGTGGVVSAGGVGFDISCGVRTLHTELTSEEISARRSEIADALFAAIPVGVGSRGNIRLTDDEMDAMLSGGAIWAIDQGYGTREDLEYVEEKGRMSGARPEAVSPKAKERQRREMGTLGSGNHYLEVQQVETVYDDSLAETLGLHTGDIKISIHCGSRGLGHQIGTEYLKRMVESAGKYGLQLPDRELAAAPIRSELGQAYLGAMRCGINCALANRQIITHLTRHTFNTISPGKELRLFYDVSHNTCKEETHVVNGKEKRLFVHRKGATRAFGPSYPGLPEKYRQAGQPVLIGGTMGTASYILAGTAESEARAFSSSCHGAGRAMSRTRARKRWRGQKIANELKYRGIELRSPSFRGVAEEAPEAYKDVSHVVNAADQAGLSKTVAKLKPVIVIKG